MVIAKEVDVPKALCQNIHIESYVEGKSVEEKLWTSSRIENSLEEKVMQKFWGFSHRQGGSSVIWEGLKVKLLILHMERTLLRWHRHLVRTPPGPPPLPTSSEGFWDKTQRKT